MGYAFSAQGRKALNEFLTKFAEVTGSSQGQQFAVEPNTIQSLFQKAIDDGAWFLGMINANVLVTEMVGQKIGLGVTGLVSTRTDTNTAGKERTPRHLHSLDPKGYRLSQTNADVAIKYAIMDQWKHVSGGKFAALYAAVVRMAIANDRLRIGWHGISAALDTDPVANPLGEDVNIGWLQHLRNDAATQIDEVGTTIGGSGHFKNIDALVWEARHSIAPQFRKDPGVRVLISDDLLQLAGSKFYAAAGDMPSEKRPLDGGRLLDTYGGLQAVAAPFMPDGTIVITNPKNLSIYRQEDSWRRHLKDKPEKDQVEDFNSFNEGYVIEENDAISVVSKVTEYVAV